MEGREKIEGIEGFPNNSVKIFNRWGNEVWSVRGYNNAEKGFGGIGNQGILTKP